VCYLLRPFDHAGEGGQFPIGSDAKKRTERWIQPPEDLQGLEIICRLYLDLYTFFTPESIEKAV